MSGIELGCFPPLLPNAEAQRQAISCVISSAFNMGSSNSFLMESGDNILIAMTVLAVAVSGMMNILRGEPVTRILADFMIIVLTWGIATAVMGTAKGGNDSLANQFSGGFDYYAARLSGVDGADAKTAASGMADKASNIMVGSFAAAASLFNTDMEATPASQEAAKQKMAEDAAKATGGGS